MLPYGLNKNISKRASVKNNFQNIQGRDANHITYLVNVNDFLIKAQSGEKMISVKILGSGCKKCQTLEAKVKDLAAVNKIDAVFEKVTDISEMMHYGIMMTPALVVNEKVKSFGIIPKDEQILNWLKEGVN